MNGNDIQLAAGLRTPFARVDGPLAGLGAVELSVPVMRAMTGLEPIPATPLPRARGGMREGIRPDLLVWGTVIPNLGYSNIAREVQIDAGLDRTVPAFSTVLACSTSMVAALEAASMLGHGGRELALVGGVESMSRVQIGLSQNLSDRLRRFSQARSIAQRLASFKDLRARDIRLHILEVKNRATGKSMGEHCEEMAKAWSIARDPQDKLALASHEKALAGQKAGFFDDLIVPVAGMSRDGFPRADTSLERLAKLQPAFDRASGKGTLTAGNSSPLTDGAAGLWVATGVRDSAHACAQRPCLRRHRVVGDPRGVHRAGAVQRRRARKPGLPAPERRGGRGPRQVPLGAAQSPRRLGRARPPVRRDRRADTLAGGEGACGDAQREPRGGEHLRRRGTGHGGTAPDRMISGRK